jgi:hypothetical protein
MTGLYLPGAVWRPISYRGQSGLFVPGHPVGYIPHVQVGNGSLWGTFEYAPAGNRRFSNAWVAKSGASEQYAETNRVPWAQVAGNPDYLAFECEGYPSEPYTAAQINTLAVWHNALGMPDLITDTPGQRGIGTHVMGGAAYGGHTCPGPGPRAGQRSAIIARAISLRTPAPTPPTPGTTDPFQEDSQMDHLIEALYRTCIGRDPSTEEVVNWLVLAATGHWAVVDLAARIAASPEAKAHAAGK